MLSSPPRFVYKPLETGNIRILELFPVRDAKSTFCKPDDQVAPLYGQLAHRQLDGNPEYDALSYVWGNPEPAEKIFLKNTQGQTMELEISPNLSRALNAIRNENDASHLLWVDAICIDQCNLTERSNEVQHMHRIYSQAALVRTWIDIRLDADDEAVRRLSILSPDHETRFDKAEASFIGPIVHVDPDEDSDEDGVGDRGHVWKSLAGMCRNPYWTRVWVQQEMLNAKALLIHCGATSIRGEDFGEFLRQIDVRLNTSAEKQAFRDSREWTAFVNPISIMKSNHALFYGKYSRSRRCKWERANVDKISKMDFITTLQLAKGSLQATDARDYVYGILSLINGFEEGKLRIKVDYHLDKLQVYIESVRSLICDYGTLRFLTAVDVQNTNKGLRLPSWVPDWSCRSRKSPLGSEPTLHFLEPGALQATTSLLPSITSCGLKLEVTGARTGKVLRLFEDLVIDDKWELDTPVQDWAALFLRLEDIAGQAQKIQQTSGNESAIQEWPEFDDKPDALRLAILKALIAFECLGWTHHALAAVYEAFSSMADVVEVLQDQDDRIDTYPTSRMGGIQISGPDISMKRMLKSQLRATGMDQTQDATLSTVLAWVTAVPGARNDLCDRVSMATWRRHLFISHGGLLGLAPEGAAIDDELWFLPGCEVPIVLRPLEHGYSVIGEAHVNDFSFAGAGSNFEAAYAFGCTKVDKTEFRRITLL